MSFRNLFQGATIVCLLGTLAIGAGAQSVHQQQTIELGDELYNITDDGREAAALEARGLLHPAWQQPELAAATPTIDPSQFRTFAWLQTEAVIFHLRWEALTDVSSLFVSFDSTGSINTANENVFLNRSSYLHWDGAAAAAGTRVHITLLNSGFSNAVTESVFKSSTNRATLIAEIVNLINQDAIVNGQRYVHGVSFDLEPFSWDAGTRDGLTTFFGDLRTALDAIDPSLEISWYVDPTPTTTQFDIPAQASLVDLWLYSAYDYATGSTPHAMSDFNNYINSINNFYLDNGVAPERFIVALSAYSRLWDNTTAYNSAGNLNTSSGWTDARYDTSLNTLNGGPHSENYVTGDEAGWYTYNDGTDHVRTWEAREGWEYKVRHALSNQDGGGTNNGRRLGGIGYWSTLWFAEQSSYDMNTSTVVARTRTYPEPYQDLQEILSPPGTTRFLITGFEGLDPRWRDPNESPDSVGDTDNDSARSIVTSPGGAGAPASTTNAMQVNFDFELASGNQLFFRHEILASPLVTSIPDLNAPAALFDSTTLVTCQLYTPAAYSGRQIRMLVVDSDGELEMSDPYTLNATGWREIAWDLTDGAEINAYTTTDAPFSSGDGTLDSAGGGERDIGFIGFLIEGGANGLGSVVLDELAYEHVNPGGLDYTINEFRYDNLAQEFIEIRGPAGAFPAGTQVRIYDPTDGSVLATYALSGSVPNDAGGFGFYVIGDPGVSNVDSSTGFTAGTDDVPNTDPSSIQIYNTNSGCVYDSVVYEAYGGLDDLIRRETHGVVDEGWPWLGRVAGGTDSGGTNGHTAGRYPDGNDTDVNGDDFSLQIPTPGLANGSAITLPAAFNFTTAPTQAFQTFQAFSVTDPTGAGLPASSNGGNAHRCVDTTGGGVMSFIGDAGLGSGAGLNVEGEIYIPSGAAAAQAIAIGFCGSQGSTFFSGTTAPNSYENGYWLIYENAAGVALDDGRPDHAGTFEFVQASHDNMDGNPVDLLGSATAASLSVTPGTWTTFRLSINPSASPGEQLLAEINGNEVFKGAVPSGGRTTGSVVVGFRENHIGGPIASEGTWIDGLTIDDTNLVPIELTIFDAD